MPRTYSKEHYAVLILNTPEGREIYSITHEANKDKLEEELKRDFPGLAEDAWYIEHHRIKSYED